MSSAAETADSGGGHRRAASSARRSAYALARRGVAVVLLEAEGELGAGARAAPTRGSCTPGSTRTPGELETRLILRAGRAPRLECSTRSGSRCCAAGPCCTPADERRADARSPRSPTGAQRTAWRSSCEADGCPRSPGRVGDRPGRVHARPGRCGGRRRRRGADSALASRRSSAAATAVALRTGRRRADRLQVAVNCAGLYADEVARLAGDDSFEIYPRKGEFFVFEPPGGEPLERILLPVPTERTKGVLVFPTVDGKVVAGPTAHDQDDKEDWSVRAEALRRGAAEGRRDASRRWRAPSRSPATPGCGPPGRECNYAIGRRAACERLINVAAIRSTGLTASLGIAEHVARAARRAGRRARRRARRCRRDPAAPADEPWWRRTARIAEAIAW